MEIPDWMQGDNDNEFVIMCQRRLRGLPVPLDSFVLQCDLCAAEVNATLATSKMQHQPHWHIICNECAAKILPLGEFQFAGRIPRSATEVPKPK